MVCGLEVLLFGAGALADHPNGIAAVIAAVAVVIGAVGAGVVVHQPRRWVPHVVPGLQALVAIVVVYRSFDSPLRLMLLVLPAATVAS